MNNLLFLLLFLLTVSHQALSQSDAADSAAFDFWIGKWDGWWYGKDSVKEFGTNAVHYSLDNTVIQENFEIVSGPNKGFKGKSFSIFERQTATWKQTWVDNSGSYMPFTGGTTGTQRYFEREIVRNGKKVQQKMIFDRITNDTFVWDWTASTDGGATWNLTWRIHYQRKK